MWISHKRGQVIWSYRSDSGDGGMCPPAAQPSLLSAAVCWPHSPGYWVFIPSSSCGQVTTTDYNPAAGGATNTEHHWHTAFSQSAAACPAAKCVNHNFAWCNAEIIMNSVSNFAHKKVQRYSQYHCKSLYIQFEAAAKLLSVCFHASILNCNVQFNGNTIQYRVQLLCSQ